MSITRGLKNLTQALVFNMAGERTKALEALANIARQANRILNQYDSGTSSEVENQLTTPSPTAQVTSRSANTNLSATLRSSGSSESVTQALLRSFPSLAARGSSKRRSSSASRSKSKKGKSSVNIVHKDIVLIPAPDCKTVPTHRTRITLENDGFIVHQFPVDKSWDIGQLKAEIEKVFPILQRKAANFTFVKACYGELVVPNVPDSISMNAERLLSIVGQGSIYLLPEKILVDSTRATEDDGSDSELEKCPWEEEGSAVDVVSVDLTDQQPSTGRPSTSARLTKEERRMRLKEMFPSTEDRRISLAVEMYDSLEEAADFLAEDPPVTAEGDTEFTSLGEIINALKLNMHDDDDSKKLKVDEEDIVADALAFYKRSDFDPKFPLRVIYKGQPAADTGGVLRHFFTDLLQKLSDTYFTGTSRKVPLYNTNILICGLMKMIGTIIVHSVVQGGPGFPFFSPAVFSYLWSGSVDAAVQRLNIDDCASPQCKEIVLKVCYALLLSNSKLLPSARNS